MRPLEFTAYPLHDEIVAMLEGWTNDYPDLIQVEEIGRSIEGRPLLSAIVTDRRAGHHLDKPAVYIEGNIHAGEVLPSAIALSTVHDILAGAGEPWIADLLERLTFYVRPRVSPDGAEVYLTSPYRLRSGPIPWPEPEPAPGLHLQDVNGDGHITLMRIEDPDGEWSASTLDPRIMVRNDQVPPSGKRYRLMPEGRVVGEIGPNIVLAPPLWGLDFNRSFPHNWQPEHLQAGSGPYPLYVPETRATADFFLAHPNIFAAILHHTSGGFVFTLPSSRPARTYPHDDLTTDYLHLTQQFTELTGNPAFPSYEEETDTARCGSLMDWAYSQLGILTWVPEHWDIRKAAGVSSNADVPIHETTEADEADILRWADAALEGAFVDWAPFEHPQLGKVEIGGWTYKMTHQNPPPRFVPELARPVIDWTYLVAQSAPRLEIESVSATPVGDEMWLVRATIANHGYLSTNVTQQALDARKAHPVIVEIGGDGIDVVTGDAKRQVGHLKGASSSKDIPFRGPVSGRRRAEVKYLVRGPAGARGEIVAAGERAGVARRSFALGDRP